MALQNGISGTVIVSFIVSKEGVICNPKIERSLGIELDNETLRIISLMPNWIPGKKDGQPVNVSFMLPVKFTIQ
ncbi:MAG: energy transducer TonB [Bacteroidetes bacterium]|nr:energy transducer TonB [Bacteroidota bacterium]